jgi:Ca2+-binding RTX toxin-like protein
MSFLHVAENGLTDIGKLLKAKINSFEAIDAEPGEFSMTGKKLFFDAPAIEFGDEYFASATITYTTKKGKILTQEFEFLIENSDGIKSVFGGDDGPNDMILGGKKATLIYTHGGDDTVSAGTGNDKLYGGDGDDSLHGNQGNDQILGEAGNDELMGGSGDDRIDGGAGDDTIYSWTGTDTITGGDGMDNFAFETDGGADIVTDFTSGVDDIYYNAEFVSEASFAAIATKTATGTLLTFDSTASVLLEGFFL